jgi:hypothetical protein
LRLSRSSTRKSKRAEIKSPTEIPLGKAPATAKEAIPKGAAARRIATVPSAKVIMEAPGPRTAVLRSTATGGPADSVGREVPVVVPVADSVAGALELVNRWAMTLEAKATSKPGVKRILI